MTRKYIAISWRIAQLALILLVLVEFSRSLGPFGPMMTAELELPFRIYQTATYMTLVLVLTIEVAVARILAALDAGVPVKAKSAESPSKSIAK